MKRFLVSTVAFVAAASLVIAGCGQAAPAAAPTKAPAAPAPTKAAEPTKASAAAPQPTAAPAAKKVDFPQKGKAVSMIVPYGAGSGTDNITRALNPFIEKELGVSVEILNKPGAGSQIGITEMLKSKPDGYTVARVNLPNPITIELNPERKAEFKRKDFQPLGLHTVQPNGLAVKADGPYKSFKDLLDAAKANPGKVRAGTSGLMGDDHLAILDVERAAGVKFASVHFDSSAEREPAVLGGKIDVAFGGVGSFFTLVKQGSLRLVAVTGEKEAKFAPGVPTLLSQGIKSTGIITAQTITGPAGMPKEVVDVWAGVLQRAINNPDHLKKAEELGHEVLFKGPDDLNAFWTEQEKIITPLMQQALAERK